jgi:hypothetical protein
MKKVMILALMGFISRPILASDISCISEDKIWNVQFELNQDVLTELRITKGEVIAYSSDRIEGARTRIFKTEYFDFDLGAPRYLQFERRIGATNFVAAFYLKKHPFAAEIDVFCKTVD